MELPLRTLKFGVDVGRKAHDFLTDVDLDSQIETAGLKAGRHVADDHDDLDPRAVHDLIVLALEDSEELADGVDELIQRGEPVAAEAALLAEELARLADELDPLAAVSTEAVDWEAVAETFLETFEREVAAMEADQRWFLLQAYNQRVLEAVTPDEFAEARANLTERGFDVVSDADFETEIEDPRAAWREPFDWQHLANDYAVDRYHGDSDRTFTQQVLATLDGGGHQLLFGPPGSGKTVACRQAAAAWHHDDDTGPVIHWRGGAKSLDPHALKRDVETLRELGDTLVVVEDAARERGLPIFQFLIGELADEPDVSVLLDAREHELDRLGQRVRRVYDDDSVGQSVSNRLGTLTERDRVPYLSVRAVDEILDRFAETTDTNRDVLPTAEAVFDHLTTIESREREDATTDEDHNETSGAETDDPETDATETSRETMRITPDQIRQTVGTNSAVSVASPMLMLSYYLPVATADEAADTAEEGVDTNSSESPLEQRVRSVFNELNSSDETDDDSTPAVIRRRAVLLMATLAAADLPIHESYLYALTDDGADREVVTNVIDDYRGRVHFGRVGEATGEGKHVFRSPHELWGLTYLYVHEAESGSPTALFEESMDAVFSVIDDESVRRELGDAKMAFRRQTLLFELLDENQTYIADNVVRSLFQIGRDRPTLVDLFGMTRLSRLELPECCSDEAFVMQSFWRSEMYRTVRGTDDWSVERGDTDEQRDERDGDDELHNSVVELLCARQTAMERDVETDWVEEQFYRELGHYARGQGDLRAAEWLFSLSLTRSRRRENDHGVAFSLHALGRVARMRGDLDKAEERLKECGEKLEETADASDLAVVLHSLGNIAQNRGEFDAAEEYHDRSLSIFEEIGDRSREAKSLGSLGTIARNRGEFDAAEEYHERSLSIFEEIGDRSMEAKSLGNLGSIARNRGEFDAAEEYHERSLSIFEEIGDRSGEAKSLHSLGNIAFQRGEFDAAEEYHERSLSIEQEIGDRSGKANSLHSLGNIALQRGEFDAAEEYHDRSLSIFEEIGDRSGKANSLHSLGNIAFQRGEFDAAEEYHERSLSIEQEIGDRSGEAKSLHSLGNIARSRGEFDEAEQFHQQSLSIEQEIGDRSGEAKSLHSLGNIARNRGEFDAAEQFHQQSLSIFEEIGDRSGEAKSLHSLGNIARNRGEFDAAEEYHERSLSIKQEIGDRSGEAKSLDNLGIIALQRGEFDAAEEYHEQSLSIKQEIGDRSGEAASLGSLGNIARSRGEFETAKDRYQSALAIFAELGQVREVIKTLQNLVRTAEGLDDEAAAVEWVERGLTQLDGLDLAGLDEEQRWFEIRSVRLDGDEDDLEGLYRTALERLEAGESEAAFDLLEGVWDCRTSFAPETDAYGICLRAGVGYAAPAIERDTDAAADVTDTVREAVDPHRDRLSESAAALHDLLVDGATDHDPDALREPADREEPDLDDLERFAYADLLEQLVGESKPLEIYRGTLRAIGTDEAEFEEVVNSCLAAWDQHTDVEGNQYRAALAAGVVLEVHREFADDLPRDRESIFGVVREHRELLSEPIEASFEYLDTGATDHDPEALWEAADHEEPTLVDLERIAVARFLTTLQSQ